MLVCFNYQLIPFLLQEEKSVLESELCSVKTEVSDMRRMLKDLKSQSDLSRTHSDNKVLDVQVKQLMRADTERGSMLRQLHFSLQDIKNIVDVNVRSGRGGEGLMGGALGDIERDRICSSIKRKAGWCHVIYFVHVVLHTCAFHSAYNLTVLYIYTHTCSICNMQCPCSFVLFFWV